MGKSVFFLVFLAALVAVSVAQGMSKQRFRDKQCRSEVQENRLNTCRQVVDRQLNGRERLAAPYQLDAKARCCQQLQGVSRECRCAAIRQMVRNYEQTMVPLEEGYRGRSSEKQEQGYYGQSTAEQQQAGEGYYGEMAGRQQGQEYYGERPQQPVEGYYGETARRQQGQEYYCERPQQQVEGYYGETARRQQGQEHYGERPQQEQQQGEGYYGETTRRQQGQEYYSERSQQQQQGEGCYGETARRQQGQEYYSERPQQQPQQQGEGYYGETAVGRQFYGEGTSQHVRLMMVRQYVARLPNMCQMEPLECSVFSYDQY